MKKTEFDLFRDLSDNGRFEVWLRCLEPAQYFGAAQRDLYIRAGDASFELNFVKAYLGIWMQMVLMIAFGVMFSTFLSGPVALTATLGALVGGLFNDFMTQLAHHQVIGGGPFESLDRIVKQQNVVSDLDPGLGTTMVKMMDVPAEYFLRLMSSILPSFGDFSYSGFVAYGYNVDFNMLAGTPADDAGLPRAAVCRRVLLPQDAGDCPMNPRQSFVRKIVYLAGIFVLFFPLYGWASRGQGRSSAVVGPAPPRAPA